MNAIATKIGVLPATKSLTHILLDMFGGALISDSGVDFKTTNQYAIKAGYLVPAEICNASVTTWVKERSINYSSTFYKTWEDITSRTRFELLLDQIRHYASTYGTNFTGEVYLPEGESIMPALENLKVIKILTDTDVIQRCEKMLFSGIALKEDTIANIIAVLVALHHIVDINLVKNKEAKMHLCQKFDLVPTEPVEMVRYLVFLSIGKTLLIKDRATIALIKANPVPLTKLVNQFGVERLSSVFYRFKPLFLAFRTSSLNKRIVNLLRRAAKDNHVPNKAGFFETLLSKEVDFSEIIKRIDSLGNFKKITLLQTIQIRMKELDKRSFVIRNQKLFIKTGVKTQSLDEVYLINVYDIIYTSLINSIRSKATSVRLPEGLNLTLPTSEKSFIGNYPLGTSFDFADADNIVGVNWRGEHGASDIDLKLITIDGTQYGWNAAFTNKDNSVIFSGDMTSANPEATELFYTKKNFTPSIVKVNLFSGAPKSKFKFFIAKDEYRRGNNTGWNRYDTPMIDPNKVLFTIDCEFESNEKSLGVITGDKFILAHFRTGKGRVSYNSVTDLYTDYALNTLDCYVSMRQVLADAGFTFVQEDAQIDLTDLSKDTLINLFS